MCGFTPPLTGWHANIIAGRLGTMLPHHAKLVGQVAKNLVEAMKRKGSEGRPTELSNGPEMVDLAITLHRLGAETQEIGTELIEDMAEIDALAVRQTLDEIDNKFRERATIRRPRLARPTRSRNRRRRNTPPPPNERRRAALPKHHEANQSLRLTASRATAPPPCPQPRCRTTAPPSRCRCASSRSDQGDRDFEASRLIPSAAVRDHLTMGNTEPIRGASEVRP